MKSYEVRAYVMKDGQQQLAEFGSGYGFNQAREYFQRLYDSATYALITMKEI